jgi:bleomycin hydrolase
MVKFPNATSSTLDATKAKMLQEIHLILTFMLGPPPSPNEKFTWQYYDADGKFHTISKTPLKFSSEL